MKGIKNFLKGIITLILACIITALLSVGIIYTIFYLVFTLKIKKFFVYLWQLIDGTFEIVGFLLNRIAYTLDLLWCLWAGELIEDIVTHKEDTLFRRSDITVSAALGQLEEEKTLNKTGKWFSGILNIAFNEKYHCLYAIQLWRKLMIHERNKEHNNNLKKNK